MDSSWDFMGKCIASLFVCHVIHSSFSGSIHVARASTELLERRSVQKIEANLRCGCCTFICCLKFSGELTRLSYLLRARELSMNYRPYSGDVGSLLLLFLWFLPIIMKSIIAAVVRNPVSFLVRQSEGILHFARHENAELPVLPSSGAR